MKSMRSPIEQWEIIRQNHRGPYRLHVSRPHQKKENFFSSEWLRGGIDAEDVVEESFSLLKDPRDTVDNVSVWSEREQCFVMSFKAPRIPPPVRRVLRGGVWREAL